jgi:hypothetical protein
MGFSDVAMGTRRALLLEMHLDINESGIICGTDA